MIDPVLRPTGVALCGAILALAAACGGVPDGDDPASDAGAGGDDDGGRPDRGDAAATVFRHYLYTAGTTGMRSFAIDEQTLVPGNRDDATTANSLCVAADPAGRFVFAAERQPSNTYSYVSYAVDVATGELSRIDAVASTHLFPYVMAVNPAGTYLFVGDVDTDKVASYAIDQTTGRLTVVDSVDVGVSASSYNDLQVHPDGSHLYVGSFGGGNGQIQTVHVSATGDLTVGGAIDDEMANVHLDAEGRFLYTGPGFGGTEIDAYRVDAITGELTFIRTFDTSGSVNRITSDPQGRFLYAARGSIAVVYSIGSNATLTFASQITLTDPNGDPSNMFSLSFHPSGEALYAHSRNSDGDVVHTLTVNATTGALAPVGSPATGLGNAYMTRSVARAQP